MSEGWKPGKNVLLDPNKDNQCTSHRVCVTCSVSSLLQWAVESPDCWLPGSLILKLKKVFTVLGTTTNRNWQK